MAADNTAAAVVVALAADSTVAVVVVVALAADSTVVAVVVVALAADSTAAVVRITVQVPRVVERPVVVVVVVRNQAHSGRLAPLPLVCCTRVLLAIRRRRIWTDCV